MKRVRVVQIGIGHDHAAMALKSLLESDTFEVIGLAVTEEEREKFSFKLEEFNGKVPFISVEAAFDTSGLDAAVIETEEEYLVKYALMAADRKLAIHMDKPGGFDEAEFERLINTVSANKTVFSMGYMYRYNPAVIDAVEKVKNGELGKIYSVEAHMSGFYNADKRKWLKNLPGGMMFFLGCHMIDLIYRLQGMPEEIIPLNTSTKNEGVESEDFGMVAFKYKNGVSFVKTCGLEVGGFMRRQLVICGSKGTIEIKPIEIFSEAMAMKSKMTEITDEGGRQYNWRAEADIKNYDNFERYSNMILSFGQYVTGEKVNPYSYEYELNLYKLLLKACK